MEAAGQNQVVIVSLEEKGNVTLGRKKTYNPTTPTSALPRDAAESRAAPSRNTHSLQEPAQPPAKVGTELPPAQSSRTQGPWFPPRSWWQRASSPRQHCLHVRDAPYLLASGVFAAEGDGLQLVASAGQSPQAVVPALKSLLQEFDGLPGSLLHLAGIACSPVLHLWALGQAIQLVYHFKQEEEVQLLWDKVLP